MQNIATCQRGQASRFACTLHPLPLGVKESPAACAEASRMRGVPRRGTGEGRCAGDWCDGSDPHCRLLGRGGAGGGSRAPSGSPWARTSYSVCIGGCRRAPLRPPGYTLPASVHLTRVAFALAAEGRSVLYGVLAGMLPALALVVRAGRNQGWHKTSQTRLGGGGIMLCLQLQCSQPHCPLARAYTTRSTCSRHRWQWGFGGDCHPGN